MKNYENVDLKNFT